MKDSSSTVAPLVSDLVLIGGGHAQVHIIKMCGMPPLKNWLQQNGIQITLIAKDVMTPYSGMLPGYIAGHYTYEQIHIDLRKLCAFAGVRLIHTSAEKITYGLDNENEKKVYCKDGRPGIRYDVLSIDVGSSPSSLEQSFSYSSPSKNNNSNNNSSPNATPVKPISSFAQKYMNLITRLKDHQNEYTQKNPFILLVVGAGAGGVEVALAMHYKIKQIFLVNENENKEYKSSENDNHSNLPFKVMIGTRGKKLLQGHNENVQKIFKKILKERGIEVHYNLSIEGVRPLISKKGEDINQDSKKELILSATEQTSPNTNTSIQFHECLWCTSGVAPSWLKTHTPFKCSESNNSLLVNDYLECIHHPGVFAAGDCCHMINHPRPKAGVFAVRAGPPLLENIMRYLSGRKGTQMVKYKPQTNFLSLISTGDKQAVASKGNFLAIGAFGWLWAWKDYIDVKFMDKFSILPSMKNEENNNTNKKNVVESTINKSSEVALAFAQAPMRCGGCGAKVGARTVSRVLEKVKQRTAALQAQQQDYSPSKHHNLGADDAAIIPLTTPTTSSQNQNSSLFAIHTIDYFRSFISDPFIFGKIAAVHAMSDCHAMGASGPSANLNCLALAVVPYAAEEQITEDTLVQMLSGATDILVQDQCELVGGHTCEGAELALGFAVNGFISTSNTNKNKILQKSGGKPGDHIILTKPIGTGAIFAADMRAESKSEYVEEALSHMTRSNGTASRYASIILDGENNKNDTKIHACTDVTGFGLAGHLLEMLTANDDTKQDNNYNINKNESIGASLYMNQIPFLKGALSASSKSILSSLHRENFRTRRAIQNHVEASQKEPIKYPLLFDPQTAGGLLFFVDPDFSEEFVKGLQQEQQKKEKGGKEGEDDTSKNNPSFAACVIGEVTSYDKNNIASMDTMMNGDATSGVCGIDGACTVGSAGQFVGQRIKISW